MIRLETSNTVTAFDDVTIGSKVVRFRRFMTGLERAVQDHDTALDQVKGQHFIELPESMFDTVSAGDGPRSHNPDDYVVRKHRGEVGLFMKREMAGEVKFLAVIVYTIDAYLADPDVLNDSDEFALVSTYKEIDYVTHMIIAVIASAGPQASWTPYRFVKNLAGGNNETLEWSGHEIREKACEVADYTDAWAVVAD
jgi:hypothetical protein